MARWSWHEKPGTRQGNVLRHSDRLTPKQEEQIEKDRHEREMDWITHHPEDEPLFQPTRTCYQCGDEKSQAEMHFVGKSWACPSCHLDSSS